MTDTFRPVLYVNSQCPFCFKVRLYLLEAGLIEGVDIRSFDPGTEAEAQMRAELAPHVAKLSFPVLQTAPEAYMTESDDIIGWFAARSGIDPASLATLQVYLAGPFKSILSLFSENRKLKAQLG